MTITSGVMSGLLINLIGLTVLAVFLWFIVVKKTPLKKYYWKGFALLVALTTFISFNSGLSSPKFVITDESGSVSRHESEVKDVSPETLTDAKRLEQNQLLYEKNKED